MGTILKKGEYVLVSRKIIEELGSVGGYGVLMNIDIDTDKLTCARTKNTEHFLTYEVTDDLELPFDLHSGWKEFTIKDTIFHPYHRHGHHLFLLHHDESRLYYRDEIDAFIQSKEKEKKEKTDMILNKDLYGNSDNSKSFSIYNNPAWDDRIDDVIFADNRAYMTAAQSVLDRLPDITLEDLRIESSVRTEPLIRGTLRVSPGIIRETRRYQFTQYADSLHWDDWSNSFKLYFGVERATGKQKTVCLWEDGEKTIIRGDKSVLRMPVQYAVAWCYVKRRFKTTSQFKKYVDNHSHIMDGITYFEGDARVKGAQASANNRTKKYDIYDAAALAITAKHYGSVKTIMNYCDGWGE